MDHCEEGLNHCEEGVHHCEEGVNHCEEGVNHRHLLLEPLERRLGREAHKQPPGWLGV